MTIPAQNNINAFSSDKWRVSLSNIPTVLDSIHNLSFLYEAYTKSVSIPGIDMEIISSKFFGSSILHNVSQKNDNLQSFTWTIKLDENFSNYYNIFLYSLQTKFGQINTSGPIRKYDIDAFNVHFLDNQRIERKILTFENCLIESISQIELTQGTSEDVLFTVTMKYELAQLKDPET